MTWPAGLAGCCRGGDCCAACRCPLTCCLGPSRLLQVLVLLDTKRSGYVDLALLIMSLLALW
jgi:hypothetical protein